MTMQQFANFTPLGKDLESVAPKFCSFIDKVLGEHPFSTYAGRGRGGLANSIRSTKELNNHIERAVTKGLLCFYPLNRQTFKSPQVELLCNNDVIK